MDNPVAIQRLVLLALVASPLVAALFCLLLASSGDRLVRGFARLFALLHVGAASLLTFVSIIEYIDRSSTVSSGFTRPLNTFLPTAIPGDPGIKGNPETQAHFTTWDLFSVQKVQSSLTEIEEPTAIQFFLGLDGVNIWLVWMTSFLVLIAVFVSLHNVTERVASFYAWLFVLQSMVIGAFTAFDIVLFYVFFELTLIPTFFLIGQWGIGGSRRDAARKFFLYTLCGSLLTLTGAIGIVVTNTIPVYGATNSRTITPLQGANVGEVAIPESGPVTFSIPVLIKNFRVWTEVQGYKVRASQAKLDQAVAKQQEADRQAAADRSNAAKRLAADQALEELKVVESAHARQLAERNQAFNYQTLFFFLLMAGFAVKVPIVPFHTWLPGAYGEAPIGVTLLLSGVLAKLGTYGIFRLVLPLTPDAAITYGLPVFGTLGAIGIIYAAFCAFAQRDIKLLVAYSSVSHLGLLILGLFTMNREGLAGSALHMLNHGISTGAMFALLAFLIDRYRTTDMTQYGGLMGKYPDYAALMVVIALATVGLPGLNNFISEMMILAGLIVPGSRMGVGYWLVVGGAAGIFLSAWYTFTMIRRVFFGPEATPLPVESAPKGLTSAEWVAFGLPTLCCLVLGLYPAPVINSMQFDVAVVARLADEAKLRAGIPIDPAKEAPPAPPEAKDEDAPLPPDQPAKGGGKGGKRGGKGPPAAKKNPPLPTASAIENPAVPPEVAPMPTLKK